ncbi:MAG: hypothetical protein KF693_17535 [Nitrospira sp.]|nr:hypothetical protein [Nitrospira sp.]
MQARERDSPAVVIAGGWVLDPGRCHARADVWIRDGRIVAVAAPGGAFLVTLANTHQLKVSRAQSRVLRKQLLRL